VPEIRNVCEDQRLRRAVAGIQGDASILERSKKGALAEELHFLGEQVMDVISDAL
jgi:hypothetical protein